MAPALLGVNQAPVPPTSYHRTMATALHLDALTLVTRLQLLEVCRVAVKLAHQDPPAVPAPLPAGPGGAPRVYTEASLLLLALLRTLWRLSSQEVHEWLCAWPALACGLPLGPDGRPRVTSAAGDHQGAAVQAGACGGGPTQRDALCAADGNGGAHQQVGDGSIFGQPDHCQDAARTKEGGQPGECYIS